MRASGYVWRALSHEQTLAIRKARRNGVRVRCLAAEYHVTARTIYRALERDGCEVLPVTVDGWRAEFEMTDEGPVRVTPWFADSGDVTT